MSEPLSRSIVLSSRFMRSVFDQVSSLVQTLERELQQHGWRATTSSDIGAGLSNRLKSPNAWMPRLISRVFTPGSGQHDRAVVAIVVLEADSIESALLITAVLRLRTPLSADELFTAWKTSESLEDALPALSEQLETWTELPDSARQDPGLWSVPASARIRAIDLALVTNEQTLYKRVVEPALVEASRIAKDAMTS